MKQRLIGNSGAKIHYSGPYVLVSPEIRRYCFDMKSVDVTAEDIKNYDCVVVGSNHVDFDYSMIH